jgi:enoyl-CoA hydratase/carnithine racemase
MTDTMGANEPILLRQDSAEGITTLTLNRPDKRNALSSELIHLLDSTLETIAQDLSVKVVILAASGPAFCSGHDLKELRAIDDPNAMNALFTACSQMMMRVTHLPQPVIARVHGIATAAGCQLVASCDLAVASDTARFGTPGVNIGLFCTTPAVAIGRTISSKHAMEMLLTGEAIDAETAYRFGLINRVAPGSALDYVVMEFAKTIATKSSETISVGKAAFYRQLDLDLEQAYSFASEAMARNMMEHDAQEGIDAFLGKRAPEWRGRTG